MANSPHPGVIQLEHPNIYQAAKQAQQDDWIRQGLKTAGDWIAERNKDIRYNKAMGKKEDRRTSKEAIADTASSAWEGIKSGASSAWGLLKAPFTEDVVTEKSYEEGVKTERPLFQGEMSQEDPFSGGMSREQTMSLEEPEPSGAVAVSFPTTVVGKDRVVEPSRREVGGKVDWDFPNKGYKTEFPTTVVGAPSMLKAPSAQPVGQKAPETPQNDAGATNDKVPEGMLQAPDYSEMFRLNPNRAQFDYTREKNAEVLAQKAEAAQARMELMQAKMEAKANAGSSLEELQQLWKENQRALVQARKDQDPASTKMYEDNIARLLPILQEKAPNVWGAPPEKKDQGGVTPPPGGGTKKTAEQLAADRTAAVKEGYAVLRELGVDNLPDGVIDDVLALERKLGEIRTKYGVSAADMQEVTAAREKLETTLKSKYDAAEKKKSDQLDRKLKEEAAAGATWSINKERAKQAYMDLQRSPDDFTYRTEALDLLLRSETGAAISKGETLNRLVTLLGPEKGKEVMNSISGIPGFIATKLQADEQFTAGLVSKYVDELDMNRVFAQLNIKGGGKAGGGGGTPPPTGDIHVKKGTIRTSGGKKYRAKRDLTKAESNKSANYEEVP